MLDSKNIFLFPVSIIYGIVTGVRNFLFDRKILHSTQFKIPVICIGNIAVGGTGKTPHTEYVAELLSGIFRVAVLSRGYKRKSTGFMVVTPSSFASETGDEPLQIAQKLPGVLVAVDADRVDAVNKITEVSPETDVIIMDDGFQHRRLTPGFSILLSDYGRPFFSDNLMPFGSLRESASNSKRADVIIVTKTPGILPSEKKEAIIKKIKKLPQQDLFFTSLMYKDPVPVFEGKQVKMILAQSEASIVLVTGIADPAPLIDHLGKAFAEIRHVAFPDHHSFSDKDILAIEKAFDGLQSSSKYVVTTEKDAVRLREFSNIAEKLKEAFYYIPVAICFPDGTKDEFDNLIIDYVRKNTGNS
jgi:tetraacyldisaccharide 4'-kinase